jgi:hypothetical protein
MPNPCVQVGDWRPVLLPRILFLNTAALVLSSLTMEFARRHIFREIDVLEEWLGLGQPGFSAAPSPGWEPRWCWVCFSSRDRDGLEAVDRSRALPSIDGRPRPATSSTSSPAFMPPIWLSASSP